MGSVQRALRRRVRDDDRGVTLVEMSIVLMIMVILMAIAIPQFLGIRRSVQNREAKANILQVIDAVVEIENDMGTMLALNTDLPAYLPGFDYTTRSTSPAAPNWDQPFAGVGSTGPEDVWVIPLPTAPGEGMIASVLSESGDCFTGGIASNFVDGGPEGMLPDQGFGDRVIIKTKPTAAHPCNPAAALAKSLLGEFQIVHKES